LCVVEELKAGKDFKEIAEKCHVHVKTVQNWARKLGIVREGRSSGETGGGGGDSAKTAFVGRGDAVQKTLASEYAELVKQLTEKTKWFNQALVEIGFNSLLAAFQYARIDPKEIAEKVEEFKDPEEFVGFVMKYIYAMIEASSESVKAIVERDAKIEKYEKALRILGAMVRAREKVIRDLTRNLQVANAILTKYGLMDEYVAASVQAQLIEQLTIPAQPAPQIIQESRGERGGEK
jgi:hypothetical protein